MTTLNWIAFGIFAICWLGYEPVVQWLARYRGLSSKDLSVIRAGWMQQAVIRDIKLVDSNLLGHGINSASFFASANLILIAAVGGALFSGEMSLRTVKELGIDTSSSRLFEIKLALVTVCLVRGLLDFIWAIRQMNYCVAGIGAAPEDLRGEDASAYARALSQVIDPAMTHFSQGVRGYYFALAAAAWLYGPQALMIASVGAVILLMWRQSGSQSAKGLRDIRILLERKNPLQTGTDLGFSADIAPQQENLSDKSPEITRKDRHA